MAELEVENADYKIGVLIQKCDLETNPLIFQPAVKVFLVDCQSGENLVESEEGVSTKPFNFLQNRSYTMPCWEELLTINRNFKEISTNKTSKLLLLFEITDTSARAPGRDPETARIAWAFLKPVGLNGNLNIEKEIRLQLHKVRKKCAVSHQSCPVFHLYTAHKRKKYPGSLYVTLKGVKPIGAVKKDSNSPKGKPETSSPSHSDHGASGAMPNIELIKWSRLPTQSCKLVNNKVANVAVNRRGVSSVAFSHSGYLLACASFGHVVIIDTLTRKQVAKVTGHTGLVYEVSWSEDDCLLLSVSADCTAIVWSIKPLSKSPLYALAHPSFVYAGKWLKSGYRLVTGGKDTLIRYWDKANGNFELIQEVSGHEGFITALETLGEVMFSGDSSGCIKLWSLEGFKWVIVRNFNLKQLLGTFIDSLILHPGQRRLAVTARGRGSFMIDMSGGIIVTSYKSFPMTSRSIPCLSPCGTLFFEFDNKNIVNVWEFDTGKLIATYENIFPDLGYTQTELSGCIAYHPHEHMAAFAVLGFNYPLMILTHDREVDQSLKLGLTVYDEIRNNSAGAPSVDLTSSRAPSARPMNLSALSSGTNSTEEKLAAIVRNIDKILAAKRQMLGNLTRDTTPRDFKPLSP